MNTVPQVLVKQRIEKAYSYSDYRLLMAELTTTQASTGPLQNEDMAYYTSLNHQRMKRLDKTVKINTTLASLIESIDSVRYTNILYRVIETSFTLFKMQFEEKFRLPCLGKKQR